MKQFIFLILVLGVISCEGIVGGDGYIYTVDDEPIDSVTVVMYLDGTLVDSTFSDDNGFFKGSEFVGCVPNCPDVKLIFKKRGYQTKILDFKEYWEQTNQQPHLDDSIKIVLITDVRN